MFSLKRFDDTSTMPTSTVDFLYPHICLGIKVWWGLYYYCLIENT